MEHLHGPPGAECVTIALEQIESARPTAHRRRIYRLTGTLQEEVPKQILRLKRKYCSPKSTRSLMR